MGEEYDPSPGVPSMAEQWWEEGRHQLEAIRKEMRIANLIELAKLEREMGYRKEVVNITMDQIYREMER